ncbi:DUF2196 domain-containing protein [bacterium]|nr:DUF2196 domain-containing protein [bacterium]
MKIVRAPDAASGVTVEGTIAEIVSRDEHDERGIEVKLASGEVGRALRVWEAGLAPPPDEPARGTASLPTHDERPPEPSHRKFRITEAELERRAREALGDLSREDLELVIDRHEDGLTGPLLKRFGLKSEEVEEKTRELLSEIDDRELERRMEEGPEPEPDRAERPFP